MNGEAAKRKLAAILSADVVGYSRLMQDDDSATVATLREYRAAITRVIDRHSGRVVNAPGDNMLAEFPSAVEAVQSAAEIQKVLEGRNLELPAERRMEFRIGVNLGDVIEEEDGTIYGDGVNVAARMEALADAGGICISSKVLDEVEGKLDFGFDFLGEKQVKNIAKPVRVYRVRAEPGSKPEKSVSRKSTINSLIAAAAVAVLVVAGLAFWQFAREPEPEIIEEAAFAVDPVLALPTGPSIAVLPFTNMSGDPEQEYFSDGITEDIITALSKFGELVVIARNSTFRYKGQAVDVQQVGRELGVTHIVEGSVRKSGNRVRVTAQLVDAGTSAHLWAERYDRDLTEIFAVQDDVTEAIVTALLTELTGKKDSGAATPPTSSVEAYDHLLRAKAYVFRFTRLANNQARRLIEKAIELDPSYTDAYVELARTHFLDWEFQWEQGSQPLERCAELARFAVSLDESEARAHSWLGWCLLWNKEHDQAISHAKKGVALDPNYAEGFAIFAEILNFAGRPVEAEGAANKAMRLDPHAPAHVPFIAGHSRYLRQDYEGAIQLIKESLARNPDFIPAHRMLAVIHGELGQDEKARAAVGEILRVSPEASLDLWRQRLPYKDQSELKRFIGGLRKAGLDIPDEPAAAD